MEGVTLKKITIDHVESLQKLGRQTFAETYAAGNTEENLTKYLREAFSITKLSDELMDRNSDFYFATLDNKEIGYLKTNIGSAQSEISKEHTLEIERIYVMKTFYGKGVGQLLFEKAMALAKSYEVKYVWLDVWEKNPRALRFYQKNGFKAFGKHVFQVGDDKQTDIMMKVGVE